MPMNMKLTLKNILAAGALLLVLVWSSGCTGYHPENGDILFQTSQSAQSLAIQKATRSAYSHMGIIFIRRSMPYVYEATEPVKLTPLSQWIARGKGKHYTVKRLAEADEVLTLDAVNKMLAAGRSFMGRHYDLCFQWSDDRVYCSELVWKIYRRALNIELGKCQKISDFDLSDPLVAKKMKERFGNDIPLYETVISPAAIFACPLLITVHEE